MFTALAALIAVVIGITLRLCWAKATTESKLYRVPLFWVVLIFAIILVTSPKTIPFVFGIFIVDLIGAYVKENEEHKDSWSKFLNWAMNIIPLNEKE